MTNCEQPFCFTSFYSTCFKVIASIEPTYTNWIYVQDTNPDSPDQVTLENHNITECLHACYEGIVLRDCASIGHQYNSSQCELHTRTRYSLEQLTFSDSLQWDYYELHGTSELYILYIL